MSIDRLGTLKNIIATSAGTPKLVLQARSNRDRNTNAVFSGSKILVAALADLLTLLGVRAVVQRSGTASDKPGRYSVVIPNIDSISSDVLGHAVKTLRTAAVCHKFKPGTLNHMQHVLTAFVPSRLSKNPLKQTLLAKRQFFDLYQALMLAEQQLFPLFAKRNFAALPTGNVVKLLRQIHQLAYKTLADERGFSDTLDNVSAEFTQLISRLLMRLEHCQGDKQSVVKLAAFAYQQVIGINPLTKTSDLVATMLLNSVLHAYDFPCIQLCSVAERRDPKSLYHQAFDNIQTSLCYLEQLIEAKLVLEQSLPSTTKFTQEFIAQVNAALVITSENLPGYQAQALKFHLGALTKIIRQQAKQHVATTYESTTRNNSEHLGLFPHTLQKNTVLNSGSCIQVETQEERLEQECNPTPKGC